MGLKIFQSSKNSEPLWVGSILKFFQNLDSGKSWVVFSGNFPILRKFPDLNFSKSDHFEELLSYSTCNPEPENRGLKIEVGVNLEIYLRGCSRILLEGSRVDPQVNPRSGRQGSGIMGLLVAFVGLGQRIPDLRPKVSGEISPLTFGLRSGIL